MNFSRISLILETQTLCTTKKGCTRNSSHGSLEKIRARNNRPQFPFIEGAAFHFGVFLTLSGYMSSSSKRGTSTREASVSFKTILVFVSKLHTWGALLRSLQPRSFSFSPFSTVRFIFVRVVGEINNWAQRRVSLREIASSFNFWTVKI